MEVAAGTVGTPALSGQKAGSSQVPPINSSLRGGTWRQGGRGQRLLYPICPTAAELFLPGLGEHGGPGPALDLLAYS